MISHYIDRFVFKTATMHSRLLHHESTSVTLVVLLRQGCPPCKVNGGLAVFSPEIGSHSQQGAYLQTE